MNLKIEFHPEHWYIYVYDYAIVNPYDKYDMKKIYVVSKKTITKTVNREKRCQRKSERERDTTIQ